MNGRATTAKVINLPKLPKLTSEEIEPTMAKIMCHLLAKCEDSKGDRDEFYLACAHLFEGMRAIEMVAICVRGCFPSEDSSCIHFSISASNELGSAIRYIKDNLGIDPYEEWDRKK
jgi:hypothetical protein